MSKTKTNKDEPTIIKKYANRRLYDTGRSSYVTLDDLCEMVQEGHNFKVIDAKSGNDITRSVLTQIIADQEAGEETLLPTDFLRSLIGFYGNNMQTMLPQYLEQTMSVFVQNQERMQDQINKSFEGMRNIGGMDNVFKQAPNLEEITRKNMEMFERAMKMMPPFNMGYTDKDEDKSNKDS